MGARDDSATTLLEPITVWDILEHLSDDHELDLLPGNVDMPEDGMASIGMYEVPVRVAFRNPEAAAGRYTLRVEVLSQQSQEAMMRQQEMARAVEQSRRFELPQRALPGGSGGQDIGFDEDDEDEVVKLGKP